MMKMIIYKKSQHTTGNKNNQTGKKQFKLSKI